MDPYVSRTRDSRPSGELLFIGVLLCTLEDVVAQWCQMQEGDSKGSASRNIEITIHQNGAHVEVDYLVHSRFALTPRKHVLKSFISKPTTDRGLALQDLIDQIVCEIEQPGLPSRVIGAHHANPIG